MTGRGTRQRHAPPDIRMRPTSVAPVSVPASIALRESRVAVAAVSSLVNSQRPWPFQRTEGWPRHAARSPWLPPIAHRREESRIRVRAVRTGATTRSRCAGCRYSTMSSAASNDSPTSGRRCRFVQHHAVAYPVRSERSHVVHKQSVEQLAGLRSDDFQLAERRGVDDTVLLRTAPIPRRMVVFALASSSCR